MDVKMGKRKRKLLLVSIGDMDLENMEESILQGEFDRGMIFVVNEKRREEALEILKGM